MDEGDRRVRYLTVPASRAGIDTPTTPHAAKSTTRSEWPNWPVTTWPCAWPNTQGCCCWFTGTTRTVPLVDLKSLREVRDLILQGRFDPSELPVVEFVTRPVSKPGTVMLRSLAVCRPHSTCCSSGANSHGASRPRAVFVGGTLLGCGGEGDLAEAEAVTTAWATAPLETASIAGELWLLRLRRSADARGDVSGYRDQKSRRTVKKKKNIVHFRDQPCKPGVARAFAVNTLTCWKRRNDAVDFVASKRSQRYGAQPRAMPMFLMIPSDSGSLRMRSPKLFRRRHRCSPSLGGRRCASSPRAGTARGRSCRQALRHDLLFRHFGGPEPAVPTPSFRRARHGFGDRRHTSGRRALRLGLMASSSSLPACTLVGLRRGC